MDATVKPWPDDSDWFNPGGDMTRLYSIAAIPGDGIGPEVISAGIEVLQALAERCGDLRLEFEHFPWGSDFYRRTGRMMDADGLERLERYDLPLR